MLGKTVTLSCSSNEEFNLCQWVRPGSLSCGILNSERRKTCPQDDRIIGMSSWKIEKEDVNKCSLTIEGVKEAEEGEWNCKLQSLPNNNGIKYDSSEDFSIKILEPAKVTMDGPMDLQLASGVEETFTCSAKGLPRPTKLEWTLNGAPMAFLSRETDGSNGTDVLKEKVTAIFPDTSLSGKRLECEATQRDALNNEVKSRYLI